MKLRSVSAVTTTVASTATSCATPLMTVETVLMRDRRTVSVIVWCDGFTFLIYFIVQSNI